MILIEKNRKFLRKSAKMLQNSDNFQKNSRIFKKTQGFLKKTQAKQEKTQRFGGSILIRTRHEMIKKINSPQNFRAGALYNLRQLSEKIN